MLNWRYPLVAAAVVPLGLSTRGDVLPWPQVVQLHGGDLLYATMVYFGLRALLSPRRALLGALTFCFTVEALQLWQAPWLEALRDTLPGRLVLGRGFEWVDLPRYAAGAALGFGADRLSTRRTASPPHTDSPGADSPPA